MSELETFKHPEMLFHKRLAFKFVYWVVVFSSDTYQNVHNGFNIQLWEYEGFSPNKLLYSRLRLFVDGRSLEGMAGESTMKSEILIKSFAWVIIYI